MFLRIEILTEKKLIGKRIEMSFANNKTFELWNGFMIRRKEIRNNLTSDLFSMQIYTSHSYFENFYPETIFEKWAAVEVADFNAVPDGMETYILKSGLYAVFIHKGPASEGQRTFQYIFGIWLPSSDYLLDDRPHFEILGEKYKNNHTDSEEEVWIPVKLQI